MNVIEANFGKKENNLEKLKTLQSKFCGLFRLVFQSDIPSDDEEGKMIQEVLKSDYSLRNFIGSVFLDNKVPETQEEFKRIKQIQVEEILDRKIESLSGGHDILNLLDELERAIRALEKAHEGLSPRK